MDDLVMVASPSSNELQFTVSHVLQALCDFSCGCDEVVLDALAILERSGIGTNGNRSPGANSAFHCGTEEKETEHLKEKVNGEAMRKLWGSHELFLEGKTGSRCVTQAEVQWCNHGSIQHPRPGLMPSSHVSLPRSWDHRCAPAHLASSFCFVETESPCVAQPGLKLLGSKGSSCLGLPKCWDWRCEQVNSNRIFPCLQNMPLPKAGLHLMLDSWLSVTIPHIL
ncbi:UPF0764 protein C16orf89 [Plecturocebus cupreus]